MVAVLSLLLLGILHFYLCNTILYIYIQPYMQSVWSPNQEECACQERRRPLFLLRVVPPHGVPREGDVCVTLPLLRAHCPSPLANIEYKECMCMRILPSTLTKESIPHMFQ